MYINPSGRHPCIANAARRVNPNLKGGISVIVGVTHDHDGRVVQRLSVSTKVSIGLPPNGDRNHPTKLDHFLLLRKKKTANRLEWEIDPELTKHYGEQCRDLHIMCGMPL
jgi:hypothetical protein